MPTDSSERLQQAGSQILGAGGFGIPSKESPRPWR